LRLSGFEPGILAFKQEKTKIPSEGGRVCCFVVLFSKTLDIRVMYGGISSEGYRVCCFVVLSSNPLANRVMFGGISLEADRVCCFLVQSFNTLDIRVMYGGISTLKLIGKFLSFFRLINRKRKGSDSDIAYSVQNFANAPQMAQHLNYAAH